MLRLTAALLVRLGLVMVAMAALVKVLPVPNAADELVDDMALCASCLLVVLAAGYLRMTGARSDSRVGHGRGLVRLMFAGLKGERRRI